MNFADFARLVARRPARPHLTLRFPDAQASDTRADEGYFQIRLSEMFLTDERKFHQEIAPATLFVSDFKYAGADVRLPFFVSNGLLGGLSVDSPDLKRVRTRFTDTLVLGPTPYGGGDVALFVGLFQSVLQDRRHALFSVFEKLLGTFDLGTVSQYLKVADKLTADIFGCLGSAAVECLLAERLVIGAHEAPRPGHIALLRKPAESKEERELFVIDDCLRWRKGGKDVAVDDHDYCLVRVERMATRNDYSSMEFHRLWVQARERMLARQPAEAQAHMLECAYRILSSPDLTEDHKVRLIEFYQARLLAARKLLLDPGSAAADRSGTDAHERVFQRRVRGSNSFEGDRLADGLEGIVELVTRFRELPAEAPPPDDREITRHLRNRSPSRPPLEADKLVQAIAAGSMAA